MTDQTRLAEIRARVEEATPGPWERGDRYHVAGVLPARFGEGKCAYCSLMGEPEWAGRRDINGTKMLAHVHITDEAWSPHGIYAYPEPGSPDCVVVETDEYGLISDTDADFIAHSRADVPYLLDLLDSLTAERDEYRRALRYLVGNEWEESAGDTLSEKAMSTVIDRQAAELSRLRAVVEEVRDEIELMYDSGVMQHGSQLTILAILDRGLKGAGE